MASRCNSSRRFPPDAAAAWEKGHHRLDRRRLKRVTVSPEKIGLCGCWQVIAVRRAREELGRKAKPPSAEIGDYATSLGAAQRNDAELIQVIRDHWSAIENGAHHRRDVSFGEDAGGVSHRGAAQVLACWRHLALGLDELARERGRTRAPSAKARSRQMPFAGALAALTR